jgi:hypothetical protein
MESRRLRVDSREPARVPAAGTARATVRLLLACDNACIFCAQAGLVDGPSTAHPGEIDEALAAARAASDAVTFVGGEPTLDPRLSEYVARARALGFCRIGVQTNGRHLGDGDVASRLAAAGLTDVHLSIHGADAAVHDYHSGVLGSFAAALGSFSAARAAGLRVVVTTVLTRSNFRALAAVPRLLASRGASAWHLSVPHVAGRARPAFDRVVPRLGLALPFALHALEAADALALPAWLSGAPSCLLGPWAARTLVEAPRAHGEPCARCDARSVCAGVDPAYLERFGGDELVPRSLPVPEPVSEGRRELAAMFVGVGEVFCDGTPSGVAELKKVSLPLLGKVKPAHGEVPSSAPRKSGESLKEILPGLFEETDEAGRPTDT